jgi:hypothetical protein
MATKDMHDIGGTTRFFSSAVQYVDLLFNTVSQYSTRCSGRVRTEEEKKKNSRVYHESSSDDDELWMRNNPSHWTNPQIAVSSSPHERRPGPNERANACRPFACE